MATKTTTKATEAQTETQAEAQVEKQKDTVSATTATASDTPEADVAVDEKATASNSKTAKIGGFKVQWQLRHNGKVYHAGDSVTLTAEEAQTLLATGVIVATEEQE